jgi:Na+-transporting methylmalonyl-CoA/oxaloacetate decarboxylase gamma subunit
MEINLIIILAVIVFLLLVILLMILKIMSRLQNIERKISTGNVTEMDDVPRGKVVEKKSDHSEFEEFLAQDGQRRMLSKREQAAAFREWRRQRGLTWKAD